MPLVTVDEYLQGCDSPTLLAHLAETPQLLYRGVFLDDYHALLDGRAAPDDGHLACLPVHPFPVFGLHRPACLFLDHRGYLFIAVSQ